MRNLSELDQRLFLALNEMHAPWLDPLMIWFSGNIIWLPLYVLLLYQLTKLPRITFTLAIVCIALSITLADQLTSSVLKPMIARPRPTWDETIGSIVHTVDDYRGGRFGFPSSHAANTFCVATLLSLILRRRWSAWLFAWAALVSYSRIYLGVHYPGDVIVGALIGCFIGLLVFLLFEVTITRLSKK